MNWNRYPNLVGNHAFLSPSSYHWVNYDDEKLQETYSKFRATQRGTELHQLASDLIRLDVKLPKNNKSLNAYVNDAIGFKMDPEITLFYSHNCYGTADTISFRSGLLRIHDLKTGVTKASIKQLEVYTALFCLEYKEDPNKIDCQLRIYQMDEILVHEPMAEEILYIMQKIKDFDKKIREMQGE